MTSDQSLDQAGGLPILEAAATLGISENAIRKRIRRKTIPAYKIDERWYVVLDGLAGDQAGGLGADLAGDQVATRPEARPRDQADQAAPSDLIVLYREALVARDDEIAFLRDQLRREQDEREEADRRHAAEIERRDVLYREALARIPALPAVLSRDDRDDAPQSPSDGPGRADGIDATPDTSGLGPPAWRRAPGPAPTSHRPWWRFWGR
jgi:hypothetical protein